jgi:catechol-2,3-dioxygenase
MRTTLTQSESDALLEAGFHSKPVKTLDELLDLMPNVIECYRYRPEQRWENMSDPTYGAQLMIEADEHCDENDNEVDTWIMWYDGTSSELHMEAFDTELIVALYKVALAYAKATDVWIKKGDKS